MINKIFVGIPTAGEPVLEKEGEHIRLRNMLIGKDFHWQRSIEAVLPGEVTLTDDPEFPVINILPIETYLECVVGSEMNPDAPKEFLKAHAIISRSWAMGKISGEHLNLMETQGANLNQGETQGANLNRGETQGENLNPGERMMESEGKISEPNMIVNWEDTCDHHGFHVCSDDHCQRYQGIQPIRQEILEAIRETEALVLRGPGGDLVDARFSKCCGGHTELFSSCWQDFEPPCLESFEDPWCDLSGLSDYDRRRVLEAILKDYDLVNEGGYRWKEEITAEEVKANLLTKFNRDIGDVIDLKISERGPSGRAKRMNIIGSSGSVEIGKELMIRRLLSPTHLYSSAIKITKRQESLSGTAHETIFELAGRGWGHGVGLCQIGAAHMALEGHSFQSILSFYYPGSQLTR